MIKTPTQLKALVKNKTHSDSGKAQLWFRNYAMERLLERISLSDYRYNFILKGGMLVSSIVGLSNRATMDIDATIRNLSLDKASALCLIQQICEVPIDDNMRFEILDISDIMEEADYPGIRVSMNAYLDTMRIPLKVDISTGDIITPAATLHPYKMMFEDRHISLWAYNLETLLAEKLETILSRGALNTRMRDFYDIHILQNSDLTIDEEILRNALKATCQKRGTSHLLNDFYGIEADVCSNPIMATLWGNFQHKNDYANALEWGSVSTSAFSLCKRCLKLTADPETSEKLELSGYGAPVL